MSGMFESSSTSMPIAPAGAKNIMSGIGNLFPSGDLSTNPMIQAMLQYMQPSQGEMNLPGLAGQYGGALGSNLSNMLMQPLDSQAVLGPLQRAFEQTIAPNIRGEAIRAGAPGGSVSGDLFSRAAGDFGSQAAEALARQQMNYMQTVGQLSPTAYGLQMMGPQAEAALGAEQNQFGVQRGMTPLQVAMQALGAFNPYIGQKTTGDPSVMSDVGQTLDVGKQFMDLVDQGMGMGGMMGMGPYAQAFSQMGMGGAAGGAAMGI